MSVGDFRPSLNLAVGWIDAHLEEFAFDIDESPDRQLLLLKPFSELVLTSHFLQSYGRDGHTFARHLSWAWDKVEKGNLFFRLLIARPDLYQLVLPVAFFALNGLRNDRLLQLVDNLPKLKSFMKFECERWVALSVLYAYELLGRRSMHLDDFEGSWLFECTEPWIITTNSTYSLTHEVFYLTDFGRNKLRIPQKVRHYIDCWGPAWIAHFHDKRDWDLVGELAIVSFCLGLEWTLPSVDLLRANQEPDGAVVGPDRAGIQLLHETDTQLRRQFLSRYHTTLVAALAFAMCCAND